MNDYTNLMDAWLRRDVRSGADLKVALSRLNAEVLRRASLPPSPEASDFFSSVTKALGGLKGSAHFATRAECLYHSTWYLFQNGSDALALSAVRCLDGLSGRDQSAHWNRKVTMLSGVVLAEVGDVPEGIVRYADALRIARESGDLTGETATLCNLGVALNYAGLFNEAIACLRRAVALATTDRCIEGLRSQGLDPAALQCTGLSNLAQSYHFIEDNRQALETISRSLELAGAPADSNAATAHIIREFTFVCVALELGMVREACQHTSKCVEYSRAAGSRARALTTICQGLCEVHAGDVARGFEILQRALQDSATTQSIRTDALLALARATCQMNQPAQALAYIERVLLQVRESRQKSIGALLSMTQLDVHSAISSESDDLRKLKLAHATLTAKAAEQEATEAHIETLERLSITANLKEEASGGHGHRVGRLAAMFACEIGWPKDSCHAIELAGRLHDIGKIGLPDRILLKADQLREGERKLISAHTQVGAEILASGQGEPLRMAQEVARFHHECWDGSGYPAGLVGPRIPVSARIVTLADVFDALTHGRSYSPAWPAERALDEITSRTGRQFDPDLCKKFVRFLIELRAQHGDLDGYLGASEQNTIFSQARRRIQLLLEDGNRLVSEESAALAD